METGEDQQACIDMAKALQEEEFPSLSAPPRHGCRTLEAHPILTHDLPCIASSVTHDGAENEEGAILVISYLHICSSPTSQPVLQLMQPTDRMVIQGG